MTIPREYFIIVLGDIMISRLMVYKSNSYNPYENLATEKFLFDNLNENLLILYIWQNENTVVIGKNQNPWAECNCILLESEGGFVARRMSGGGAVFHDKGNLNFTFICSKENYDLQLNFNIIKAACEMCGIGAELDGRNDILVKRRKFSGNAFYHSGNKSYHHGTLLISTDGEKINRYLTPDSEKLKAKGVKSVKSRVINLSEINSDLTPVIMSENLIKAAEKILKTKAEIKENIPKIELQKNITLFSSWDYIYGNTLPFSHSFSRRLDFGNITVNMNLKNGIIEEATVYTDAMDFTIADKIESALKNCKFEASAIKTRLKSTLSKNISEEISSLITNP